jgi:hypothetical protein
MTVRAEGSTRLRTRIPLIAVRTREPYLAICWDDQSENRFESYMQSLWELDEDASSLLAAFALGRR